MIDMFSDLLIVIVPALVGSGSALLTKKLDKKYYPNNEMILQRSRTLMLFGQVYFDFSRMEHIVLPQKVNGEKLEKDDISTRIELECDSLIIHVRNKKYAMQLFHSVNLKPKKTTIHY